MKKQPLPDVAGFVDGNAKYEEANAGRLDALEAAKAKPGLRLAKPGESRQEFQRYVQAIYDLNNLGYLHFEHLLRQGRSAEALKLADGLLLMDGRLRAGAVEGYNQALQGAFGISGLATSFRNHYAVLLRAETPQLTSFLADLNATAAARVPIQDLTVAQREYLIRTWQDLPNVAGNDPDHFKVGRAFQDRLLLSYMASRATPEVLDRFRGIFDRTVTAVAMRDFATLRQGRKPMKWTRPSPLTWTDIEPPDFRPLALLHPAEGGLALALGAAGVGDQAYAILRADAEVDAWRLRVAEELYRRAKHRAPWRQADLVPAYLPAVIMDPFSPEHPLGYADGKIWSVGPDGHDDGGRRSDNMVGDPLVLGADVDIIL
jgi:hypothetical protein